MALGSAKRNNMGSIWSDIGQLSSSQNSNGNFAPRTPTTPTSAGITTSSGITTGKAKILGVEKTPAATMYDPATSQPEPTVTTLAPKMLDVPVTPVATRSTPTAQSAEWDMIKRQNAARLGLAESTADRNQAQALQAVRENAYESGLDQGTRAFGAMEQRAIDESSQQRADLVNTASQQNLAAEMAQTQQDTAEQKALKKEQFDSEISRLSAIMNDTTQSEEIRLGAAQQIDTLNKGYYGSSLSGSDLSSYETTLKAIKESNKGGDANTRATTSLVESTLANRNISLTDAQKAEVVKNASYLGLTTPADIANGIQSGILLDSDLTQLSQNKTAVKNYPEKVSQDQWIKLANTEVVKEMVDHPDPVNEAPGVKYGVGDTLLVGGIPFMVTSNYAGEGFIAKDLTTGLEHDIKNGISTGVVNKWGTTTNANLFTAPTFPSGSKVKGAK